MKQLVAETQGMKRFVITGRATFSAGITPALPWREAGDVIFVGEPVGDDLDFWAEGGNIRLPNSGYDAHFANSLHSYSPTPCPAEVPCLDSSVQTQNQIVLPMPDLVHVQMPFASLTVKKRPVLSESGKRSRYTTLTETPPFIHGRAIVEPGEYRFDRLHATAEGYDLKIDRCAMVKVVDGAMVISVE